MYTILCLGCFVCFFMCVYVCAVLRIELRASLVMLGLTLTTELCLFVHISTILGLEISGTHFGLFCAISYQCNFEQSLSLYHM